MFMLVNGDECLHILDQSFHLWIIDALDLVIVVEFRLDAGMAHNLEAGGV